ncbi:MAG: hypothetical protein M1837_001093 [Sclerophora amabilis]|nr:MAG: hypothetical protein M1837_001093 [Sclerophora amabilis]
MFYDLNVPWTPHDPGLQRTLAFLHELDYNVVALNHTISGKLPSDLNHRLASLSAAYDILAVRPTNERALQQACQTLNVSLISMDLTVRHPFHFRQALLRSAIARGVRFEICYAPGILATDQTARRNLISNATQLIRATRGRAIVFSSEAARAVGVRAPFDVVNLGAVWGLSQEKGKDATEKEPRAVVVMADMKKSSWRGVIDVIDGGVAVGNKRKAETVESEREHEKPKTKQDGPMSKRQAKKARLDVGKNVDGQGDKSPDVAQPSGTKATSTEKG